MIPTRDIGTRYNGLATVPQFAMHVPPADEAKEDVRKLLNEVKHLYFDRRYRQCASKCIELLEKHCQDVRFICPILWNAANSNLCSITL